MTWLLTALWVSSVCPWLYITVKAYGFAGAEQNYPAPNVTLALEDVRQVHLVDLQGKVVLLDFWATWCAPCRASEPALNVLSQKGFRRGFVLARISGDEDTGKWKRYVRNYQSGALEILDQDSTTAEAFRVISRPTFVLVDRKGTVRWRQGGWTPYSYFTLKRELMRLLA